MTTKARTNRRAERVWQRLVETYGSRFVDQFGVDPNESWIESIELLTDEQISFGLRQIKLQSPDHPPTQARFARACVEMPTAQLEHLASLQEQLCEYVMVRHYDPQAISGGQGFEKKIRDEINSTWTYVYREWTDENLPKFAQRCAECVGVVIERQDGSRFGFSVAQMQADTVWHQYVISKQRKRRPGEALASRPTETSRLGFDG